MRRQRARSIASRASRRGRSRRLLLRRARRQRQPLRRGTVPRTAPAALPAHACVARQRVLGAPRRAPRQLPARASPRARTAPPLRATFAATACAATWSDSLRSGRSSCPSSRAAPRWGRPRQGYSRAGCRARRSWPRDAGQVDAPPGAPPLPTRRPRRVGTPPPSPSLATPSTGREGRRQVTPRWWARRRRRRRPGLGAFGCVAVAAIQCDPFFPSLALSLTRESWPRSTAPGRQSGEGAVARQRQWRWRAQADVAGLARSGNAAA